MVNPWKTYVKLSGVLMGSHGLTKGSLAYLNYPAQIMFKSTKVYNISLNQLMVYIYTIDFYLKKEVMHGIVQYHH